MNKVAIIILSIIAFAACSVSEVVEQYPLEDIVLQPSTGAVVRSVYDKNNPLEQFYIWGIHNNNGSIEYVMDGLAVDKQSDGSWSYGSKKYWPEKGTVDFYGIYPSTSVAETIMDPRTNTPVSEVDYTVSDTKREIRFKALRANENMNYAAALPDLVYAVSKEQSKLSNPVSMLFRHAMSVVRFEIKNESSWWTIRFRPDSAVVICNVNSEGTYTLPDVNTSADVATNGSWDFSDKKLQNFTVFTGSDVYVEGMKAENEYGYIRPAGSEKNVNSPFMKNGESAVMLPCTATAWDPKSGPATAATQNGAYFKIYCRVEVTTPSMQTTTSPYVLWGDLDAEPTEEGYYAPIYVPVTIDWKEGVNYKYTFALGRGLAYDEDGKPSVVPITFSTSAESFTNTDEDLTIGN